MKEYITKCVNNVKAFFINLFKNEWLYMILFAIVASFALGSYWQYHNDVKAVNENIKTVKIDNVREFVEHPTNYQLDTLYRKANDTLYIDTIKIKYLK